MKARNNKTKFYNSGLYTDNFYTKHYIDFGTVNIDSIEYDYEAFAEYYYESSFDEEDYKLEYYETEEERIEAIENAIQEGVYNEFWERVTMYNTCFEPLKFNEKVALECGLVPFVYEDTKMLALGGCGLDLSPRLDAYQVLMYRAIDKYSSYFRDKDYFSNIVGSQLLGQIEQIIMAE